MNKWDGYLGKRAFEESNFSTILEIKKKTMPRPEYAKGEIKLAYKHLFTTGHLLTVAETPEGTVAMTLKRPDGQKINLTKKLVPQQIKLITPTYAKKNNIRDGWVENGLWCANKDYIAIGDMKDPQSFFALLHELGHKQAELQKELSKFNLSGNHNKSIYLDSANYDSVNERGAWYGALKMVRKLKKEHGVNLMELFESVKKFNEYLLGILSVHGYYKEFEILSEYEDIVNDEEVKEVLREFFDKPVPKKLTGLYKAA